MNTIPIGFDPLLTHVTEDQLQTYITKMIPKIDINQRMSEEFHEYYAVTATQKFIFFLDNRNSNTVPVRKVAHSKVMAELLQLCRDGMKKSSIRTRKQVILVTKLIPKYWYRYILYWFDRMND